MNWNVQPQLPKRKYTSKSESPNENRRHISLGYKVGGNWLSNWAFYGSHICRNNLFFEYGYIL